MTKFYLKVSVFIILIVLVANYISQTKSIDKNEGAPSCKLQDDLSNM